MSHDSNNNNGNSRNVDAIASEFRWRYNNVSEESAYDFFLDPFMHTLIQGGVSRIMYIAILFLSFSEFVGLSDIKYAIAQDYHISGSLCNYC